MKRNVLYFLLLLLPSLSAAQELNCRVEVNSDQIQGTNKEVFTTLKEAITEYINDRKWSTAQISPVERIDCSMLFTVKEYTDNRFVCELQVQSRPLVFSETSIESNLTAVINFYVYMILGVDFDSFSPMGGTPFYELAHQVVNLGQSSMEAGWKAFEDTRNRHALLSAFIEQGTAGFRQLWYDYHRGGLDEMALSVDKGRAKITDAIQQLQKVYEAAPMSVLIPLFKDAKLDELVNVYSKAPVSEKESVYETLSGIYPTENTMLEKIRQTER